MISLTGVSHNPAIEEIVDILCSKTQVLDRGYFRATVAYFIGEVASSMRASVNTKDRGEIPVNVYALALATSGYGKGHSTGIMENDILSGFRNRFRKETFGTIAEQHLWSMATHNAVVNQTDQNEEFQALMKEFKSTGAYLFTFSEATPAAVKQQRHKLLLANCGSLNLVIDEIGSNLIGQTDTLNLFLELYDQGRVKSKLIKNTNDNQRAEDIDGKTPTNMLLFGTPAKLFDGGQTEDQFTSFLETGYSRRCIYGYGVKDANVYEGRTAEEIYNMLINPQNNSMIKKWHDHFLMLADPSLYNRVIQLEDAEAIKLLEYKIECEKFASKLPDHAEVLKAEISHRYFKALKVAGSFAFIEGTTNITMTQLLQAILLIEESGEAFKKIIDREKNYMKVCKYIATAGIDVTHADLHGIFPFYKTSNSARNEMITMATAWGYKQHIIIKKFFDDGIELFRGETLEKTDPNKLIISYSGHEAYNYTPDVAPFSLLVKHLFTQKGFHWANHHFRNNHRTEENAQLGFNMVVLDIDGDSVSMETASEILADYKHIIYSTKRHTDDNHRFRLVLPINYVLNMDTNEYKEFIKHFLEWLPFKVDYEANQRSRKWLTNPDAKVIIHEDGDLVDALKFIPKTSKNDQFIKQIQEVQSMDSLERWFAQRMAEGSRNNNMIKFALALVDSGKSYEEVQSLVLSFNKKLSNPLPEDEIMNTIMQTVAKRYTA